MRQLMASTGMGRYYLVIPEKILTHQTAGCREYNGLDLLVFLLLAGAYTCPCSARQQPLSFVANRIQSKPHNKKCYNIDQQTRHTNNTHIDNALQS